MRTCLGMGPGSLPADAHDAHVLGEWGQEASQLMLMVLMMRTCLRIGPGSLPAARQVMLMMLIMRLCLGIVQRGPSAHAHDAYDAHVLGDKAREPHS